MKIIRTILGTLFPALWLRWNILRIKFQGGLKYNAKYNKLSYDLNPSILKDKENWPIRWEAGTPIPIQIKDLIETEPTNEDKDILKERAVERENYLSQRQVKIDEVAQTNQLKL